MLRRGPSNRTFNETVNSLTTQPQRSRIFATTSSSEALLSARPKKPLTQQSTLIPERFLLVFRGILVTLTALYPNF